MTHELPQHQDSASGVNPVTGRARVGSINSVDLAKAAGERVAQERIRLGFGTSREMPRQSELNIEMRR